MTQTSRLGLPLLQSGQAQKEFFHNEALLALDTAVGAAVEGVGSNTPPASPTIGACHIVGPSPTGAWAGHPNALAGYGDGGWRFIAPTDGLTALVKANGTIAVYRSGAWETGMIRGEQLILAGNQLVGARLAAVADPTGGSIIDTQARAAIALILARLRQHGLIAS